ncbi:hypothetical protein [Pseudomonas sp. BS3782 TE3695]|uniref:hypothetical protein n=1 Tax=Pseudomonas TaxID=286 RepID=UPI003D230BB5
MDDPSSWKTASLSERCDTIERILASYRRRKLKFDKVTYLARSVAEDITAIEKQNMQALNPLSRVQLSRRCHSSTLLRSRVYRPYLDSWFGAELDAKHERAVERKLRFELLVLSNKYDLLERKYLELMALSDSDEAADSKNSKALYESEAGFMIVDSLLKHFRSFYIVENGALVEPSAMRPVIVNGSLYSSYLKWRSKLIS